VIKAGTLGDVRTLTATVEAPRGQVLPKVVYEAKQRALQILRAAEQEAQALRVQAAAAGRADAIAEVSAQYLALCQLQSKEREQRRERSVALAQLLAEQLVGEALRLDRELIGRMAGRLVQQLRGQEAPQLQVHPDDHASVQQQLQSLGLEVLLVSSAEMARGELCLDSPLGRLELRIAPGLERLAARLRTLLSHDD
jgi:flagellar biosynthesis/type III secretory pathway protein FliH